jgi:hypothetical protein
MPELLGQGQRLLAPLLRLVCPHFSEPAVPRPQRAETPEALAYPILRRLSRRALPRHA